MDDIIKMQVKKEETLHQRYLNLLALGKGMKAFTQSGFFGGFGNSRLIGIASFAIHGLLLMILYALAGNFLYGAIIYAAFRIALLVIGNSLIKSYTNKLNHLGDECIRLHQSYYHAQCQEHGIENESISYEDGICITRTGVISAMMQRHEGCYRIYRLSDYDELTRFNEARLNLQSNQHVVAHSASIELKKRFGIIAEDIAPLESAKFFTPTMQLGFVKASVLESLTNITMMYGCFGAKADETVEPPTSIEIFKRKSLKKHFKEVDTFCAEMRKMADALHTQLLQLQFLLNNTQ